MVGGNHFRPQPKRRASDPSLEEMLRRARDAPLGDDLGIPNQRTPHLRPVSTLATLSAHGGALSGRAAFWTGVVVGALMMYLITAANPFARNAAPQSHSSAQYAPATAMVTPPTATDTALPAPADSPVPTPTNLPTAAPEPTVDQIVTLVQQFYDSQGPFTGTYVFVDATAVDIQRQDDMDLSACIAYEYAAISSPQTVVGTDTRLFTLTVASDGSWQVAEIGDSGSCSLG